MISFTLFTLGIPVEGFPFHSGNCGWSLHLAGPDLGSGRHFVYLFDYLRLPAGYFEERHRFASEELAVYRFVRLMLRRPFCGFTNNALYFIIKL